MYIDILSQLMLKCCYILQYLEKRFNHKAPKLVGTIILIIMQLLYMGVALFSPATALEAGKTLNNFNHKLESCSIERYADDDRTA